MVDLTEGREGSTFWGVPSPPRLHAHFDVAPLEGQSTSRTRHGRSIPKQLLVGSRLGHPASVPTAKRIRPAMTSTEPAGAASHPRDRSGGGAKHVDSSRAEATSPASDTHTVSRRPVLMIHREDMARRRRVETDHSRVGRLVELTRIDCASLIERGEAVMSQSGSPRHSACKSR